jgi:hypothetical protein
MACLLKKENPGEKIQHGDTMKQSTLPLIYADNADLQQSSRTDSAESAELSANLRLNCFSGASVSPSQNLITLLLLRLWRRTRLCLGRPLLGRPWLLRSISRGRVGYR